MTIDNKLAVYKRFQEVELAQEFEATLKENNIECQLVDNSQAVDITFTGNTLQNEIQLLIKQSDFEAADRVLENEAVKMYDQVDKDYYLFEFSNEELYEILLKSDEWSSFDYKLAQKLLSERGQEVNEALLNTLKKQRLDDLSKPEEGQKPWIVMGYIFAFLGGLLGFAIGWYIRAYRKTLPNGQKINAFNDRDRKHGRNILIIGAIFLPLWITFQIYVNS
jgi:hypothetical protein